jgi:hypothetical protein
MWAPPESAYAGWGRVLRYSPVPTVHNTLALPEFRCGRLRKLPLRLSREAYADSAATHAVCATILHKILFTIANIHGVIA